MKRFVLLMFCTINIFVIGLSQNRSISTGVSLFGIKDNNPYGGGVYLGYEYRMLKFAFLAVEARLSAGKLSGDGLYETNPVKVWDYFVDYFMVGVIPRFYFRLSDEFEIFADTETGFALIKGKTFFSETNDRKPTKQFNYHYYSIKAGIIATVSEKIRVSFAAGYFPMDITDLVNSNLPAVAYRFRKQTIDISTSFSLHIIL